VKSLSAVMTFDLKWRKRKGYNILSLMWFI
jgi:hypothetical protein